jgi:hypothetical protein
MSKWKAALKSPSAGNRLLDVVIGVINHPYFLVYPPLLLSPVGSGGDILMSAGRQIPYDRPVWFINSYYTNLRPVSVF